jgi:hypothetical protein
MREFIRPDKQVCGLNKTFGDFWSWAYSDTLSNSNRSVFAEYLVGHALDALKEPRREWDHCDLRYKSKLIEVKASAYIQSWAQRRPSTISFDIGLHRGWNAETNAISGVPARCADYYVFCLFADLDPDDCVVADASRWEFYVASSDELARAFGDQKRAGLSSIRRVTSPVKFENLRTELDRLIETESSSD